MKPVSMHTCGAMYHTQQTSEGKEEERPMECQSKLPRS